MKVPTVVDKLPLLWVTVLLLILSGCASVPMASREQDAAAKTFSPPASDKSAIYVFRNSFVGQALRKIISIDGTIIGASANKVYFYQVLNPGRHTITTESEFGDNSIAFQAQPGKNYFARQYIKMGVFVGGSNVEMVSEDEGKSEVLQCGRAQPNSAEPIGQSTEKIQSTTLPNVQQDRIPVPYINELGQQRYAAYLKQKAPRAFAISDNGHYGYAWGTSPRDPTAPADPKERALKLCSGFAGKECVLFSVDDEVVFKQ